MKTYRHEVTRQPLLSVPDGWRPGMPLELSVPTPPRSSTLDVEWRLVSAVHFRATEWAEQELVCYWEREL